MVNARFAVSRPLRDGRLERSEMPVLHDDRVRPMTAIVEARGLRKRFGEVEALAGLDLVADSGQVTALLGPNGAGKTTFISAVATLVRPDSGELYVAGIDAWSEAGRVR